MGVYLNPFFDYFTDTLKENTFVDKTELISLCNNNVNTSSRWMGVSRPRRFGKSLAARMLLAYYSKAYDTRELFSKLKISKQSNWDQYLNKFDVLYFDLIDILNGARYAKLSITDYINLRVLPELNNKYNEILKGTSYSLPEALSILNVNIGIKFVIIIDEWDMLFREEEQSIEKQKEYLEFLNNLFKGGSATNFTALAYVTGILPIQKYKTESKMNNFREYSMTSPKDMAKFMGFIEEDVSLLCTKNNKDKTSMSLWYDGYNLKDTSLNPPITYQCYCPNSVCEAVSFNNFENYWTTTGSFEGLKDYISLNFDGLQDSLIELLSGKEIAIDISNFNNDTTNFKTKDDVLTLLIHLGYLAYDSIKKVIRLPNSEVSEEFTKAIKNGKDSLPNTFKLLQNSENVVLATLQKDENTVANLIDEIHESESSLFNYNKEDALTQVINIAYFRARDNYLLSKELKSGKGRSDLVFIPKQNTSTPPIIVELKWNKSVESAIEQIKSKNYSNALNGYKGSVLLVGINYNDNPNSKNYKKHECKIEEVQLNF